MADWPAVEDIKKVLNVNEDADNWTDLVDSIRASAIELSKRLVGAWDEDLDEPTEALALMALRIAELLGMRPDTTLTDLIKDAHVQSLLLGHRRRFAIA
jgi:DICT domain-containing protein